MRFRIRPGWRKPCHDGRIFGYFGPYVVEVGYDNDSAWTYTVEYENRTVREFGDYIRSFGNVRAAKEAAERWIVKQSVRALQAVNRGGIKP